MKRILIVKLGAMGDVLRTTPLIAAYRRKYPGCRITWVVDRACQAVLKGNAMIDELLEFSPSLLKELSQHSFDVAINLDKEKEALDAIEAANAQEKFGFGWNRDKTDHVSLNAASEYAVQLGKDDDLKFRQNQKTYQEISFEQAELPFEKDEYLFKCDQKDLSYAKNHLQGLGFEEADFGNVIGINTGSGERFAGKRLPLDHIAKLAKLFYETLGRKVLLLGGPEETQRNKDIEEKTRPFALNAGTHHSITQFSGIVSQCALVVTGDTIAMHIAIATKTPALVFFGSTCASEIELYGRGRKIVSDIDCAPCYKRVCPIDEKCMSELPLERLLAEAKNILKLTPHSEETQRATEAVS